MLERACIGGRRFDRPVGLLYHNFLGTHRDDVRLQMSDDDPELYWDSTYAIALALIDNYPSIKPDQIGLRELWSLIVNLPTFSDDPGLATERILMDVQITWYEEATQ